MSASRLAASALVCFTACVAPHRGACRVVGATTDPVALAELGRVEGLPLIVTPSAVLRCAGCERHVSGGTQARALQGEADARRMGGGNESRDRGGGSEARALGGDAEARQTGGGADRRTAGGGVDGRRLGGGAETRKLGGGEETRKLAGGVETRRVGGASEGAAPQCSYEPVCSGYVVHANGEVQIFDGVELRAARDGCVE